MTLFFLFFLFFFSLRSFSFSPFFLFFFSIFFLIEPTRSGPIRATFHFFSFSLFYYISFFLFGQKIILQTTAIFSFFFVPTILYVLPKCCLAPLLVLFCLFFCYSLFLAETLDLFPFFLVSFHFPFLVDCSNPLCFPLPWLSKSSGMAGRLYSISICLLWSCLSLGG